jgi:hypothetical protein
VSDESAGIEYCYEQGWTDGLPVVPPTEERVEAMLALAGWPPEEVLASHSPTGRVCSVFSAAVNAVMAGCLPQYFPVVIAALQAMNEPAYNFHASTASTGGAAPLLIVSGPVCDEIGMNSGVNVLGPGNRANATIGRAIRLIILNVFKMTPGVADMSTHGHPGKYTFCLAENAAANPWEPLNVELGYPPDVSTVTVFASAGTHNAENHFGGEPESVLLTIADTMASLGALTLGESVVILSPEHARIVAAKGWSKRQAREYLFEHARRPLAELKRVGKIDGEVEARDETSYAHKGMSPDDILIIVAGGDAGGHSVFVSSWSRTRASLRQTKPIGVCVDCEDEAGGEQ